MSRYPAGLDRDPVCLKWFDLGLSTRAAHCLRNFGVSTTKEMIQMDWNAFAKAPNVGPTVLRECAAAAAVDLDDKMRPCRHIPSEQMARELRRRGWVVTAGGETEADLT